MMPGGDGEAGRRRSVTRPPPWRDVRVLRASFQGAVLAVVLGLYWFLANNLVTNLRRQGIRTDFGFLDQPAGFRIADSDFDPSDPVLTALRVGVRNTAVVAAAGIVLATILGTLIGIGRLSRNWLVRKGAAIYVESLRNIPVVIVIVFFYTAVVLKLPPIGRATGIDGWLVLSNSGAVVPSVRAAGPAGTFAGVVALAAVAAVAVAVWRTRLFAARGVAHRRGLWATGVFAGVVVAGYVALGGPVELSRPVTEELSVGGGIRLPPEFAALLVGLVLYTASHIAEIVRGSIQAVPRGQGEAALALGLSERQRMRLVVLPQAARIMIPPLSNQFLNLTKNSSLAIFIAYPEVTRVTRIAISQGSPAPQAIAVLMLIYLAFSLTISLLANLVNRRLRRGVVR